MPGDTAPRSDWRPSASSSALQARAAALAAARAFFARKQIMEVETPVICAHGVTDPFVASIPVDLGANRHWLRTSPEYHMKRLLAAGAGDIYQIGKVFRGGETGRNHQPEFTLIEWYRLGFERGAMLDETCELIVELSAHCRYPASGWQRISYAEAFARGCGIDPINASAAELRELALTLPGAVCDAALADQLGENRSMWLDLLASHAVYPALDGNQLWAVDRYPADQAMLARLDASDPRYAERFEIFWRGVELANGFRELTDATEQSARFECDRALRNSAGLAAMSADPRLLAALQAGLPDCSGVAVGLDRVLLVADGHASLADTLSFPPGS